MRRVPLINFRRMTNSPVVKLAIFHALSALAVVAVPKVFPTISATENIDKLLGTAALANTILYVVLSKSIKATSGRGAPLPLRLEELVSVVAALLVGTLLFYGLAVVFGAPLYT